MPFNKKELSKLFRVVRKSSYDTKKKEIQKAEKQLKELEDKLSQLEQSKVNQPVERAMATLVLINPI